MGQIARVMSDGLRNLVSGLGGANDKAQGSTYVLKIPTRMEIDACYRGTWLGRKIHDIPALDMTREWRAWQADDDQIEAIELIEKNLAVRARVRRALVMARLYGGAAIIMGLPGNPTAPAPEKIGKGQLKYLHVVHRHQLSLAEQVRDLNDPHFGKPSMIRLNAGVDGVSGAVDIHPSRVVSFSGNQLPDGSMGAIGEDWYWGDPVLVSVFDALTTHDTGTAAIAALLNEAKVDVVHVPGFMDNLTSDQYERTLIERFTIAGMLKSITNTLVLDGGDGTENSGERWEMRQMNWAGLPEIQRTLFQLVSGASDIPATRLIGQSPTGMNATGEGDTRNYYDMLSSLQNSDLTPTIAGLDEYLIMNAIGTRDPSIFYEWNPLWQMSPTEKATRDKQVADTANIYATMGVVPDDAFAVAVQNRLIEDGVFPGLEAAIEEADKVARLEQEEPEPGAVDPATGLPIAQPGQPAIPAPANQNDPNAGPVGKRPALGAGRGKATGTLSGNSKRRAANDRARARIRDAALPLADHALLLTDVVDYNKNHVQSGENGGQFTSGEGSGGAGGAKETNADHRPEPGKPFLVFRVASADDTGIAGKNAANSRGMAEVLFTSDPEQSAVHIFEVETAKPLRKYVPFNNGKPEPGVKDPAGIGNRFLLGFGGDATAATDLFSFSNKGGYEAARVTSFPVSKVYGWLREKYPTDGGKMFADWEVKQVHEAVLSLARNPATTVKDYNRNHQQSGPDGGRFTSGTSQVAFEVAPDPDNKEQLAAWNALSDAQKAKITEQMTAKFLPQIEDALGVEGSLIDTFGGYEGQINPARILAIDDKPFEMAGAIGTVFDQKAMVVIGTEAMPGLDENGVISVFLPNGNVTKLRALEARLGEFAAGGWTYEDGKMQMLNFSGKTDKGYATAIDQALGGDYEVGHGKIHSALIGRNEYVSPRNDKRGNPWGPISDRLRDEFARELGAKIKGQKGGRGKDAQVGDEYNPNQPRDPGGEGGGRWVSTGAAGADPALNKIPLDKSVTSTLTPEEVALIKQAITVGTREAILDAMAPAYLIGDALGDGAETLTLDEDGFVPDGFWDTRSYNLPDPIR